MLSLTHSPIDRFIWRGKIYKLDLAFDTVLIWQEMEQDKELDSIDKWEQSCKLFFGKQKLPDDPDFYAAVFKLISDVITDNPYGNKEDEIRESKESIDEPRPYDYKRDAGAIYASFFQQYHIDLSKERGKMHWTIFKALLDGLGKNTYLQRIIQIRQEDTSKITDPDVKNDIVNAQNYYAVDGAMSEKELEQAALQNDGMSALFNSLFNETKGGK